MSQVACSACGEVLPEEDALEGPDRLHGRPERASVRICEHCGSGRTFPLVASDELGRLYPAGPYASHGLPKDGALRLPATVLYRARYWWALRRGTFGALRRARPGRLLDVGSGRGDLGVVLGEKGWSVTGLEPSGEAAEEARSRGVASEQGTLTTRGRDLAGEGYDVIVFQHSLEHVAEPLADLQVARELLRAGGRLIVSVPNFDSWQRRRFGSRWFHLDLPRHRSHFSREGLGVLLRRSGFTRVTVTTSTSADGLPMSLQYGVFGRRRFGRGPSLIASTSLTFLLLPLTLVLNAVHREGDVLNVVAFKPSDNGGPT